MQVKSIAECSKGSILQYFRPSLRLLFVNTIFVWSKFLSGRFKKIFLYMCDYQGKALSQGYKTFYVRDSTEHEISTAHTNLNAKN